MDKNKITDEELSALLGVFSDMREARSDRTAQTFAFKLCIIFINIYIITFLALYTMIRVGVIATPDHEISHEIIRSIFDGKANIAFWLLASINVSLYFNLGFRITALCSLIYTVNSFFDSIIMFSDLINSSNAPYLTALIFTNPIYTFILGLSIFLHRPITNEL